MFFLQVVLPARQVALQFFFNFVSTRVVICQRVIRVSYVPASWLHESYIDDRSTYLSCRVEKGSRRDRAWKGVRTYNILRVILSV